MDILVNETGNPEKYSVGILVMKNVQNLSSEDRLRAVRQELEDTIRTKYAGVTRNELKSIHPMDTYASYYKKFGYTYHVLLQLESVLNGKPIPSGLPLVEAMFMAELKNMVLTAAHDLEKIDLPMSLRISTGEERFTTLSGRSVITIPDDMMIVDRKSVLSSILRGPDSRTAITAQTTSVVYTAYAPFGIEEPLVYEHMRDIESYVRMASDNAVISWNQVF
jgi:DNA/RNA-binding domain of Phe-tRNA-synthetase-like protein